MTELHELSARSISQRFAERTLTPSDYAEHVLALVARWEPSINAMATLDPDSVRRQAEASTRRWARGEPFSEIDGVTVTLKEMIPAAGALVPLGSAATQPQPGTVDSPVAACVRESGAVVLGRTTVPDFGILAAGISSLYGVTRNPWNPAFNTGGSSSGTAAAAAASYGPLHVGTDIGGSIRIPSAWCGLVGFKPSNGRVPIDPYYMGRCAGPMTRTVDDAALLMRYLTRPDARDATSLPPQDIDWNVTAADVRGLRIGLMLDAGFGLAPAAEVVAAVRAAAVLFEAHGAHIVEVAPMLTAQAMEGLNQFWQARFWGDLERLPEQQRTRALPYLLDWASEGAGVTGVQALRGFQSMYEVRASAARLFEDVDLVLSPTNPTTPFPAEWASPVNDPGQPFVHIAYTVPWNIGEQPAVSINCGFTDAGMPIGLQIVGPRFADAKVLAWARAYESWRGLIDNWPRSPCAPATVAATAQETC